MTHTLNKSIHLQTSLSAHIGRSMDVPLALMVIGLSVSSLNLILKSHATLLALSGEKIISNCTEENAGTVPTLT